MGCHADLTLLFGCSPSSAAFKSYLQSHYAILELPEPQIYPDAVYFSLLKQGISFVFDPVAPYKPKHKQTLQDLELDSLKLSGIDLYSGKLKAKNTFSTCSLLPLSIPLSKEKELELTAETSGQKLVEVLGEPGRKGGGSQRVAVWLEWPSYGLKFELVCPSSSLCLQD
jgi:hypothetical protein